MTRPANASRAVRCAANTAGIARLAGIVAGALLLACATLFPAPAQAQTATDPVWSTTMTVGQGTGTHIGYESRTTPVAGSLGDNEFTVSGTPYVVRYLKVSTNKGATLSFDTDLPNRGDYILEWAGVVLPLSETGSGVGAFFQWDQNWLATNASSLNTTNYTTTLPLDTDVTVCLRTADQVCPTGTVTNMPPVFPAPDPREFTVLENSPVGTNIGTAVTATDPDTGDTLTYSLAATPHAAHFQIDSTTGQLQVKSVSAFNHESNGGTLLAVKVVADDSKGGTAEITVRVTIEDVDEAPGVPRDLTVTGSGTTSLQLTWKAPGSNVGRPDIESYNVEYRAVGATNWIDVPQDDLVLGPDLNTTISPVDSATSYEVRVRTVNHEGHSPWVNWIAGNSPATGAPTIGGAPQVGQTLTARKGSIADTDNLPTTTFPTGYSFQWVRVASGGAETNVGTNRTYSPVSADVGSTIRVKVTFTDGAGNPETRPSVAKGPVLPAAEDCADRPNNDWCATMTVGRASGGGTTSTGFASTFGSLDDDTIDYGTRPSNEVEGIFNRALPTFSQAVILLEAFVPRGTVFNFGGTEFTADSASEKSSLGQYEWDLLASFDWIVGQKVTVSANLAPDPESATVDGTTLVLTHSEPLDTGSTPAASTFSVKVDGGTGMEPSSVLVGTTTVTLTLETAVTAAHTNVTVDYDAPTSSPLQDVSGLDAPDFTIAVTNNTVAALSALTVNDGTDDHTIDLATTTYTVNVANGVETVTLMATPATGAAVTAVTLGGTPIADTDFNDGITVPVPEPGAYVIVVTVTAADGRTATYTVTVRRAGATTPPAPTDNLLIGTDAGDVGTETITSSTIYAQEFSTGSNENGYTLKRMWLANEGSGRPNDFKISIWSADSSDNPDTELFGPWEVDRKSFDGVTAVNPYIFLRAPDVPENYLDPNTTYFIVAETNGPNIKFNLASRGTIIRERGWSIATTHRASTDNGLNWSRLGNLMAFKIWGTANPSPARLGEVTVTASGNPVDLTRTGTTYKGEIPAGTNTVTINAKPGDTTSTLEYVLPDGSTVSGQSRPQVVPVTSDLTEVDLKITSADNRSKTFKVHLRRAADSAVQAPATGTITIKGAGPDAENPVVGGTLVASVGDDFSEPNGTYFAETGRSGVDFPSGVRRYPFHFVWYADHPEYNPTSNTYIILGRGPELVLTQNMRRRRITVEYAFTDDLDNYEALYSVETGAVRAAESSAEPSSLSAKFADMPAGHGGAPQSSLSGRAVAASPEFTFTVRFSESFPISYLTMRDHVFTVTNGRVTRARRLDNPHNEQEGIQANQEWEITVAPDAGAGDVTITLPETTDCAAAGAVCSEDGTMLSGVVSVAVPHTYVEPVTSSPLGASFVNVPAEHGGASEFTFELHFSESFPISYLTLRDAAFTVANGRVTRARRLDNPHNEQEGIQANQEWEITVAPDAGAGDVTITLPETTSCNASGAICTEDGTMLSGAVSVAVPHTYVDPNAPPPPPPLRASFANVPAEHDGTRGFTFELRFSESFPISYLTVRDDAFTVTNGRVTRARRLDNPHNEQAGMQANQEWEITVAPDAGAGDVTITLPETTSCNASGAVCTGDGLKLSNTESATVAGPPSLSIADAQVQEAAAATLEFTVSLNRAAAATVTVDWATADGTATAGSDYTADFDILTFAPGETAKTVSVAVLDDSHDEGGEMLTVTLSNPSGAYLADAEATGTINNSDPMPAAWLTRFGRTASDHVVDAIAERWRGGEIQTQQTHFTLGGRNVDKQFGSRDDDDDGMLESSGAGPDDPALEDESAWARMDRFKAGALAGPEGVGPAGGNAAGSGLKGAGAAGRSPAGHSASSGRSPAGGGLGGEGLAGRGPAGGGTSGGDAARSALMNSLGLPSGNLRDLLMGSSFFYSRTLEGNGEQSVQPGWLGQWSAWGRTAATRFSGADGALSLNGEVATAILGADARRGRWLMGVTLSRSEGDGVYTHPTATGGAVGSTLTSLNPYVHYRLSERTSLWGVAGYGVGGLKLTLDGSETAIETDLATAMAAFGGRGVFSVRTSRLGAYELAVVSDVRVNRTESDSVENLMGAAGATSRVRVMLEGAGSVPLATGGVLTPTLEAGLRYDGGDAETGGGLEVGAGLGYAAGALAVEVKGRMLLAHGDTDYEEQGFSGSLRYRPRADGRGLSISLGSAWGATQSGVQSLWSQQDVSGLARGAAMNAGQRFQAELGYGIAGRGRADALWIPFLGAEMGAGGAQSLRMGVTFTSGPKVQAGLELGQLENGQGEREHAVQLRGTLRW